jgi:predicted dehydrogenase
MKRRRFLAASTAAFGFQVVPAHVVLAAPGRVMPNDKIQIAGIGAGGRAAAVLDGVKSEDIVALCDVDDRRAAGSFGKYPQAERFKDFRVMLDRLAGKIDAVYVATPDHTHAPAALAAMRHGKHVYCEKPLAHSIGEVRAMRNAAREMKVITQVGNQGHSAESIRVFRELIDAGAIGNITEVHAARDSSDGSCYQAGKNPDMLAGKEEVPKELAWDLWQGPAAERPYYSGYLPGKWRGFSAFGSGSIGDWVCHVVDPVFWAAGLEAPVAITAETEGWDPVRDRGFFPAGVRITFEFPAKGGRPPVKLVWFDGKCEMPRPLYWPAS